MYEAYISQIKDYVSEIPNPSVPCRNMELFEHAAHVYWAGQEVISLIEQEPDEDPCVLLREFRKLMSKFIRMNPKSSAAFEVARDVVDDILLNIYMK